MGRIATNDPPQISAVGRALYGTENDGSVTISADNSSGGNMYMATDFTLEAGVTLGLSNAPLVVLATNSITIDGTIDGHGHGAPGGGAVDNESAGNPGGDGAIIGSHGTGGAAVEGSNGNPGSNGGGGAGGGTPSVGWGGDGGDSGGGPYNPQRAEQWKRGLENPFSPVYRPLFELNPYVAGGGGSGGGGDGTPDPSGAGGAGGSGVLLAAPHMEGAGTIDVSGADGGNATNTTQGEGSGGGGGGNGGIIGMFAEEFTIGNLTTDVTGGLGGSGASGENTNGGDGAAGLDGYVARGVLA